MKLIFLCPLSFTLLTLSCNNQSSNSAPVSADSVSVGSSKIKTGVDSSIAAAIVVQNRIKHELDSMGMMLKNTETVTSLGPAEFKTLQSGIGERMSDLGKITRLEPMLQEFNAIYAEVNNSGTESGRKEKIEKLAAFARIFNDSIRSTIYTIENH